MQLYLLWAMKNWCGSEPKVGPPLRKVHLNFALRTPHPIVLRGMGRVFPEGISHLQLNSSPSCSLSTWQQQQKISTTTKTKDNNKKSQAKDAHLHHLLLDNNNKNSKRKGQVAHPPAPPSTRPGWSWSANSRQPLHLRSECPPLACSQARPPCHHVPTSDWIFRDLTSTVHLSPLSRALFRASAGSTLT